MKRGFILFFAVVAGAAAWERGEAAGAQPPKWMGARAACNQLQQRDAWQQCVNRVCAPIQNAAEKASCVQRGEAAHDSGIRKQAAGIRSKMKPEQDKLAGFQKQLADVKKRRDDLQSQIAKLQPQVESADTREKRLRGEITGLEGLIRGQRSEMGRQCGSLRDAARKASCEKRIQDRINDLDRKLKAKRPELFSAQDRLRKLRGQLTNLQKNLSGYASVVRNKESQVQAQQRAINGLRQQARGVCGQMWDNRLVPGCMAGI